MSISKIRKKNQEAISKSPRKKKRQKSIFKPIVSLISKVSLFQFTSFNYYLIKRQYILRAERQRNAYCLPSGFNLCTEKAQRPENKKIK